MAGYMAKATKGVKGSLKSKLSTPKNPKLKMPKKLGSLKPSKKFK